MEAKMMEDFIYSPQLMEEILLGLKNWRRKFLLGWKSTFIGGPSKFPPSIRFSSIKWGKQQKIPHQNNLHHNRQGKGLLSFHEFCPHWNKGSTISMSTGPLLDNKTVSLFKKKKKEKKKKGEKTVPLYKRGTVFPKSSFEESFLLHFFQCTFYMSRNLPMLTTG